MTTPDYVDPFTGWKKAFADPDGYLFSRVGPTFWTPGEKLVAECLMIERDPYAFTYHPAEDEPPCLGCSCGIYAHKDQHALESIFNLQPDRNTVCYRVHGFWAKVPVDPDFRWVYLQVKLWGRIVLASRGYRGQYAYPVGVVSHENPELVEKIASRYGFDIPDLE